MIALSVPGACSNTIAGGEGAGRAPFAYCWQGAKPEYALFGKRPS
jgi:hypothetical protein